MAVSDWLLAHQGPIQTYCWMVALAVVACWEALVPRRAFGTSQRRWRNNAALTGIGMVLVWLCAPIATVECAAWAEQHHLGLLNMVPMPRWLAFILGMLALDLMSYGLHRLFHASSLLWRLHHVHHSDLELDAGTSLRHHPGEFVIMSAGALATIMVIGPSPMAVLAWATLNVTVSVLNHGNVLLPSTIERVLRLVIQTPDLHRIHHSTEHIEASSNFGAVVPWWDLAFGTFSAQPQLGHDAIRFGVDDDRERTEPSLWGLLNVPLRAGPQLVRS